MLVRIESECIRDGMALAHGIDLNILEHHMAVINALIRYRRIRHKIPIMIQIQKQFMICDIANEAGWRYCGNDPPGDLFGSEIRLTLKWRQNINKPIIKVNAQSYVGPNYRFELYRMNNLILSP